MNFDINTSDLVAVTSTPTVITFASTEDYGSFLLDNQGDKQITFTIPYGDSKTLTLKLQAGTFIELELDDVPSITFQTDPGETSSLFYLIRGNKRTGV